MHFAKLSPFAFLLTGMLALTGCDGDDGSTTDSASESETHSHESESETHSHESETDSEGSDSEGSEGSDSETGMEVDYDADIQPLWTANCSCHLQGMDGTMTSPYLTLNEGSSLGELVGVDSTQVPGTARVAAGDPENSYLWHKLNNTHLDIGGSGTVMPPAGALAQGDLDKVEAWINSL